MQTVPLVAERAFSGPEDLRALLETKSQFSDEHVEGVYVRVDRDPGDGTPGHLMDRAKVVHPEFIQNITDHWMSKKMVRNQIKYW